MGKYLFNYFIKNDDAYGIEEFDDLFKTEGKCIYEVLRVIAGSPLFLKEHLDRLENSLKLEDAPCKLDMKTLGKYIVQLINLNRVRSGNMRIVINRGDVFIYQVGATYPTSKQYSEGVKTILYFGERHNPNAKVVNDEFRNKVNEEIKKNDAFEAILVDRNGNVTEGSKSNIFFAKDGVLITAPVGEVLPGITRYMIMKAAERVGIKVEERNVNYNDIKDMDGLFISGTSPKVLPIREVKDIVQYNSVAPVIINVMKAFDEVIDEDIRKVADTYK